LGELFIGSLEIVGELFSFGSNSGNFGGIPVFFLLKECFIGLLVFISFNLSFLDLLLGLVE
jgi:hypothetical protein